MANTIYLDNSTTAQPSERAINAMMPYLTTHWGIPSAPHLKGQELYPFMGEFYQTLYDFVGAKKDDQLVLTSSGAEAVNHVIASTYRDVTLTSGKNHFLTAKTDDASSMMAIARLEPFGCSGKMIKVNKSGIVTAEALADSLSPRTALVSLSWGNGMTGVIQPVAEIADLCRQRGVKLHLDATHILGKLYFDPEEIKADFLTLNGDQIHAPKGTGIVYARGSTPFSPFIFGSADQGGLRAGGVNMASLAALATAAKEALEAQDYLSTETARLRCLLEESIVKGFPQSFVCFADQERLPHCTTILFPGIVNETLLFALNRKGVCASIGGGNFQQLTLLLTAIGVEEILARSAVSFSLSRYTTEEEIEKAAKIIVETAGQLAQISASLDFSHAGEK